MTAPLGKKPTACVPCHERKVRCDSTAVGFPCSRCVTKDRTDLCIMLERGGRNANKRRRIAAEGDNLRSPRQVNQQTPVRDRLTFTQGPACVLMNYISLRVIRPMIRIRTVLPLVSSRQRQAPTHSDMPLSVIPRSRMDCWNYRMPDPMP